ncbi:MAG: carbon-nitrogen hydrolase family protein [Betaproteobacteria bacterium]|nr:carbon-nitrogen hydrolase family protein [Betaproteobacteria bacterium]
MRENSYPEAGHPALPAFQALARETRAWLLVGSLTVKVDDAPASSEQGPAERGAGPRLRDATAEPAISASVIPAPCASPGSDPKGNPLPPCDAPRLRDAKVRESGAAPLSAGAASVSGVTSPEGAPVPPSDGARMANRSYLLSADGDIAAHYDKIHMFDVTLPSGKVIRESSAYRPGDRAVIAATPWGPLGMTVCYDLRFPHLYRALAQAGAIFLAVPSSFQRETGVAHWHTLLRARAIENLSYVFAPAMCGEHPGNRTTYGHSLMIDPWGKILAELGGEPGVAIADINTDEVVRVRAMLPSLEHDRAFSLPPAGVSDNT